MDVQPTPRLSLLVRALGLARATKHEVSKSKCLRPFSDQGRGAALVISSRAALLSPDVIATAASTVAGRPITAPIATNNKRASRPPSREPIPGSGVGGIDQSDFWVVDPSVDSLVLVGP